jgi:hypothetical protein
MCSLSFVIIPKKLQYNHHVCIFLLPTRLIDLQTAHGMASACFAPIYLLSLCKSFKECIFFVRSVQRVVSVLNTIFCGISLPVSVSEVLHCFPYVSRLDLIFGLTRVAYLADGAHQLAATAESAVNHCQQVAADDWTSPDSSLTLRRYSLTSCN